MAHQQNVSIIELDTLKSGLEINTTNTTYDDRLERIIASVSRAIETYLNRPVLVRLHSAEKFDGDGSNTLLLVPPIIKITVLLNDTTTVAATDYEYYEHNGEVVLTDGTVFVEGPKKISVTFKNGWELAYIPEDIAMAAEIWGIHMFHLMKDDRVGVLSKSKRDQSITYSSSTKMPDAVREMISPYRLVRFGG